MLTLKSQSEDMFWLTLVQLGSISVREKPSKESAKYSTPHVYPKARQPSR